jgi:hypothetical protein
MKKGQTALKDLSHSSYHPRASRLQAHLNSDSAAHAAWIAIRCRSQFPPQKQVETTATLVSSNNDGEF